MALVNLEPLCARYGMAVYDARKVHNTQSSDVLNVINKSLGVLVENGFYAMAVFMLSCNKKPQQQYGEEVLYVLTDMLADKDVQLITKTEHRMEAVLQAIRAVTTDLPSLILARRLADQALIFARYHCKALKKDAV